MQPQHLADEAVERGQLAQAREREIAAGPVHRVDLARDRGRVTPDVRASSTAVQLAVFELVWKPANMIHTTMPGISSSASALPSR